MRLKVQSGYMKRTFDLARLGIQLVRSNPTVGCIIVNNNIIIGEGYFKNYGESHAEVNAFRDVKRTSLLKEAVMYVSLEPCCIVGKTGACTNVIKQNDVSKVVISVIDKTSDVDGNGVTILENAGVEVIKNIEKEIGEKIAKSRNIFAVKKRPYIILKWAQSQDGFIAATASRTKISNPYVDRLVHKWRGESDAILIGTNTAIIDNPKLSTRLYYGTSPIRIVIDKALRIPSTSHLYADGLPTWIITAESKKSTHQIRYIQLNFEQDILPQLMEILYKENIGRLFVEGGSKLLKSFIQNELHDELRIIKSNHILKAGVPAPKHDFSSSETIKIADNSIEFVYIN